MFGESRFLDCFRFSLMPHRAGLSTSTTTDRTPMTETFLPTTR